MTCKERCSQNPGAGYQIENISGLYRIVNYLNNDAQFLS